MNIETLTTQLQSSGLFNQSEISQWSDRMKKEGLNKELLQDTLNDIRLRVGILLTTLGITEESSFYKELMAGYYDELKKIGSEYREGEEVLEHEAHSSAVDTDKKNAEQHIQQARSQLT
ncbi:MAG: hypothetical protein AAB400_05045 [Patescibacteria group bacterium]